MCLNQNLRRWLRDRLGTRVKFDEPMSRHTSLRVGGPAEAFVKPADKQELVELVGWVCQNRLPCLVVGDGTNLLVSDRGIAGPLEAVSAYTMKHPPVQYTDAEARAMLEEFIAGGAPAADGKAREGIYHPQAREADVARS